jgi:tetratricopeptide (TPR) repeat protein
VVFSRIYYGEFFNPVVFAEFVEAKKYGAWNPLQPSPEMASTMAPTRPVTLLSSEMNQTKVVQAEISTNEWMVLSEEERQLVRTRKIQLAQNTMRDAEKKWLLGQRKDALESLYRVLDELPDYIPLVMQMAEFYQESGDLSKAEFFWEKVKLLSDEKSQEWRVAKEHLAQFQQQRAAETTETKHLAVGAGKLRVVRVEEKHPSSLEDLYDLHFNLEITLSANLTEPLVDSQQTRVEILFFDQYETSSGVFLPIRTISTSIRPARSWSSRENETIAVTYSVPRGYWRKKLKTYGKSYDFCGYVVRVYYRGEFQDAAWNKDQLLPWRTPLSGTSS